MSGIEIIGIAASVLQIADLGGKLSVKLFTFSRKIKNAHKSINQISQDIAATGAILQQLGYELKKDEQLRLCSQEAVFTAKSLVEECNKIFVELNHALDSGKSQTHGGRLILGWKDRLKFSFLEPQIDLLRSNLERLKSSLAVMLNVMIFAEQLRNQEALPILKEQRELIKVLVEDKQNTQKKFEQALKTIDDIPASEKSLMLAANTQAAREISNQTMEDSLLVGSGVQQHQKPENVEPVLVPPLPVGILRWKEEIEHHSALVKRLLDEVSAPNYDIDHAQRHRIHEGILHVHWEEWSRLRKMYNRDILLRAFSSRHPVVSSSICSFRWLEMRVVVQMEVQLERDIPPFKYEDHDSFSENLPQYPGLPIMKDTAASFAEVVKPPSLTLQTPAQNEIQHVHTTTPQDLQLPPTPPSGRARKATSPPQILDDIPISPHSHCGHPHNDPNDDSDDDSNDGLFSMPLSNKRSTIPGANKSLGSTQFTNFDSPPENRRSENFASPSIKPTTPALPAASLPLPVRPHTSSRTVRRVPGRPHVDSNYQHTSRSSEQQYTAEEENTDALIAKIELRKQEEVSSTRNALPTPISTEEMDRNTLFRAKQNFEVDSKDEDLNAEIDVHIEALSGEVSRLKLLARSTSDELEAQNQRIQTVGAKSDRLDGANIAETDVVDDLLVQWTNLSKHELQQIGQERQAQKTERLRKIR